MLLSAFLAAAISSCTKTGTTGPAGPLTAGTLTGLVTIYDQYGYKAPGYLSGVAVSIPGHAGDTTVTTASGAYTISNLKTGVYHLVYAQAGSGTALANDCSFLGGGTRYRDQTLSLIPTFSLFGVNDTIETYFSDLGLLVRGTDAIDGAARQFIIFGSDSPPVSSAAGIYVYNSAIETIKAGAGTFSAFLTSQQLTDADLTAGSSAFLIAYPYSSGQPTYVDPATGKTVYTALGSPSAALTVTIP